MDDYERCAGSAVLVSFLGPRFQVEPIPALVGLLREDAAAMTVIDKLQVLEQAGVVPDADGWMRLREIRNQLAHDYEDDPHYAVVYLNDVFAAVGELKAVAAQRKDAYTWRWRRGWRCGPGCA